ncbi:MAG: UPF0104 family protein [Streptosporangiales bacterium]|nr:UPF0104 family protein [Streptosporangiales bacterium]
MTAVSLVIAAALVAGLPYLVGIGWQEIFAELAAVRPAMLVLIIPLWLLTLLAYAYVLKSSLPGLTLPQGLTLNAAGSAVSNMLPFGGAAGVALTFAMARSWGHRTSPIAASTLVTGVWNVFARLLLPAVGLAGLVLAGRLPGQRVTFAAVTGIVLIVAIVVLGVVALRWPPAGIWLGHGVDRLARLLPRRIRPPRDAAGRAFLRLHNAVADICERAWGRITAGMAAYIVLQYALFVACLYATGGVLPAVAVSLAAYALGRVLTSVMVTPGGFGISETGTVALLVQLGMPPGPATAGTLLFAVFTFVLEIPAGGAAWAAWSLNRRWRQPPPRAATVEHHPVRTAHEG